MMDKFNFHVYAVKHTKNVTAPLFTHELKLGEEKNVIHLSRSVVAIRSCHFRSQYYLDIKRAPTFSFGCRFCVKSSITPKDWLDVNFDRSSGVLIDAWCNFRCTATIWRGTKGESRAMAVQIDVSSAFGFVLLKAIGSTDEKAFRVLHRIVIVSN